MKIRHFLRLHQSSHVAVIMVALVVVPCVLSNPAERRTLSLVDRLMNPIRQLANLVGRKLTYHPPEPRPFAQLPGQMHATATHYVKIPTWHKVYMAPVFRPLHYPYPQKYFLHGMSYPVHLIPEQQPLQQVSQQQQQYEVSQQSTVNVQPAVSTYPQPVLGTESTLRSAIRLEPTSFPSNAILQQPQPEVTPAAPEYYRQPQIVFQSLPLPSPPSDNQNHNYNHNYNQVESPPEPMLPTEYNNDANNVVTSPSVVDSANLLNEMDIATDNINPLQEQLPPPSPPSSYENFPEVGDTSNSANSMRIILIQPTDIEKTKSTREEAEAEAAEVSDFMKGYTMKFIDLAEGAQEMVVTSQKSNNAKPEVENKSCVEPLCDPFLRKLIPELLQSTIKYSKNDEPLYIVKHNEIPKHQEHSASSTSSDDTYLKNHKLNEEYNYQNEPDVSVYKAVDESEIHDTLQAQSSTLKPQRIHFPRKLISAKINSTFYRTFKPKRKSSLTSSLKSPIPSSRNTGIHRKLQRFQNSQISTIVAPSYRRNIQVQSAIETAINEKEVPSHALTPLPRSFQVLEKSKVGPVYSTNVRRGKVKRVTRGNAGSLHKIHEDQKQHPESSTANVQSTVAGVLFN